MRSRRIPDAARGYALLEAWIVLAILTVLLSGLALPLAAQVQLRRQE